MMFIYIYIYIYTHTYIYLLVCFYALTQGNAYKPTKEPIDKLSCTQRVSNSRPPDWSNTASCHLSSTFASCHWNCVKKTQSQWHVQGCTGQLTTRLECTGVNFNRIPSIFHMHLPIFSLSFVGHLTTRQAGPYYFLSKLPQSSVLIGAVQLV